MNWPTWEDVLLRILPLEVYEEISYDMADIFSAAYRQYPPAQEKLGSLSIPQLQELAGNHAIAARNYDPYAEVHDMQEFVSGLYKLVQTVLIAIIMLGLLTGSGFWVSFSRGLLDTLGSIGQILISLLLGGPTFVAIISGLVLLYAQILSFNTFVVQTLNRQLAIGMGDITNRDEEKLVGFFLWNSSLNGGSAIKLLAIFSVLWILSATPWWDPYGYIKKSVERNIGIFGEADGVIDAMKLAYHQIRESESDLEGEEAVQ